MRINQLWYSDVLGALYGVVNCSNRKSTFYGLKRNKNLVTY